ncbi:MAG: GNAT family N-acetyltransferase [Bacilli bacterium]
MIKKTLNNENLSQLELYYDNILVGKIEYLKTKYNINYSYIYVNPEYRGQKISKQLAYIAYDNYKQHNLKTKVTCKVLRNILENNDEFNEMIFD